MNRFRVFIISTLLVTCLSGCGVSPFDEQHPYSVEVSKYRSLAEAETAEKRLLALGLDAFIVPYSSASQGKWFYILLGRSSILEKSMKDKIEFEDVYGLSDVQLINYNQMSGGMFEGDEDFAPELIDASDPIIPEEVEELLETMPHFASLRLEKVNLFLKPSFCLQTNHEFVRKLFMDLPRGISQYDLLKKSSLACEVVYEDELKEQSVTVQAFKLRQFTGKKPGIVDDYTKKILDTRRYGKEESSKVEIDAGDDLYGNLVAIASSDSKTKRYLLLTDELEHWLFILQLSSNQSESMLSLASFINDTGGLLKYSTFYNLFYALPHEESFTDQIAVGSFELLKSGKKHYPKKLEGHYKGKYVFTNANNQVWDATLYHIPDKQNAKHVFRDIFIPSGKKNRTPIDIVGNLGWETKSGKTTEVLVNFPFYIAVLSTNSTVQGDDIQQKLYSFQLFN